jgi:hypothetical protein
MAETLEQARMAFARRVAERCVVMEEDSSLGMSDGAGNYSGLIGEGEVKRSWHVDTLASIIERAVSAREAELRQEGEWACKFYCDWYDGKAHKGMGGGQVAYEAVSAVRKMLSLLPAPPQETGGPKG